MDRLLAFSMRRGGATGQGGASSPSLESPRTTLAIAAATGVVVVAGSFLLSRRQRHQHGHSQRSVAADELPSDEPVIGEKVDL